jgi:hypothetical protein
MMSGAVRSNEVHAASSVPASSDSNPSPDKVLRKRFGDRLLILQGQYSKLNRSMVAPNRSGTKLSLLHRFPQVV